MEWIALLKGMFIILAVAGLMATAVVCLIIACCPMDKAEKGKNLWSKL